MYNGFKTEKKSIMWTGGHPRFNSLLGSLNIYLLPRELRTPRILMGTQNKEYRPKEKMSKYKCPYKRNAISVGDVVILFLPFVVPANTAWYSDQYSEAAHKAIFTRYVRYDS